MSQFTRLWKLLARSRSHALPYSRQEWDAVSQSAELMAWRLTGKKLSLRKRMLGAAIVHYFVAASSGAFYAAFIARRTSTYSRWSGPLFGLAMWVVGNELALPALRLTLQPSDYTVGEQVNAFGEHIIYGLTTELLYCTVATHVLTNELSLTSISDHLKNPPQAALPRLPR